MGFLDRFSKGPKGPDAFTIEVVARIRALPDVEGAEAIDADTVSVTWGGGAAAETIDISAQREPWKGLRGFDRIEFMDGFIAGLGPGAGEGAPPAAPQASPPATADRRWTDVAARVLPVLRAAGSDDDAVTWPLGDLLEVTAAEAVDAPPLTAAQCDVLGVGTGDLRAAVSANLRDIDPAPDQIAPDTPAWVTTAPSRLQSSWLAAPGPLLDAVGLDAGIVLVPLRSELVIVDPADTALVETILRDTLVILEQQTDTLCPVPFLVTRREVRAWEPPDDHPAVPLVRRTRELLAR